PVPVIRYVGEPPLPGGAVQLRRAPWLTPVAANAVGVPGLVQGRTGIVGREASSAGRPLWATYWTATTKRYSWARVPPGSGRVLAARGAIRAGRAVTAAPVASLTTYPVGVPPADGWKDTVIWPAEPCATTLAGGAGAAHGGGVVAGAVGCCGCCGRTGAPP